MRWKSLFVVVFISVIALSSICAQAQTNFKQLPVTVEVSETVPTAEDCW